MCIRDSLKNAPLVVTGLPALPNTLYPLDRLIYETVSKQLYRSTGTAWESLVMLSSSLVGSIQSAQVAGLDAAKLTGTVVAARIADLSISTAKFATGLQAVEVLGSLPATGNTQGRMVLLTTDSKLYRYTGSAWTAAVAATDLTGTIDQARIAALDAIKISGTLTNAQVAGLDAAKLFGTLSGSLLDGVAASKLTGTIDQARIAALDAIKISGTLTNEQVAGLSAAKLTGQIVGTQVKDGEISTAKIAVGAITAASAIIANATVGSALIIDGAITNAKIGSAAIGTANIQDAAIVSAKVGSLEAEKITAGYLDVARLRVGCITAATGIIANATIGSALIIDGAITNAKIGSAAIGTANIQDAAIVNAKIGSLDAGKITTGYLAAGRIDVDTISTGMIQAGAITADELHAGAITIGSAVIQDGAIRNALIGNAEISSAKIANLAVGAAQIADACIVDAKIGSLNADKITAGTVNTNLLNVNQIRAGMIQAAAIASDEIAANAITAGKLATELALIGDIRSSGSSAWYRGDASHAPIGFRLSGPPFQSTPIGGSPTWVNLEIGTLANFGGYLVGSVINRTMLAYNRIVNGSFYFDLTGWTIRVAVPNNSSVNWDGSNSPGSTGGCATFEVCGHVASVVGYISQAFTCPPGSGVINLEAQVALTEDSGFRASGYISFAIINTSTGAIQMAGTYEWPAGDYTHTPVWHPIITNVSSFLAGGGDYILQATFMAWPRNVDSSIQVYLDAVKLIV